MPLRASAVVLLAFAAQDGASAPPSAPRAPDLPLRNDCEIGLVPALQTELGRGDERARALARPLAEGEPPAALAQAFDAWHRALALGAEDPGALVALPEEEGGASRGGECIELALARRLDALGPAGWRAWRERFARLAEDDFARTPREDAALERCAAVHFGTSAALRAALCASDLARERGDEEAARAALARARRQQLTDEASVRALAAREAVREAAALAAPSAGATPLGLEPEFERELPASAPAAAWTRARRAGPALAALDDGRLAWAASDGWALVEADGSVHALELAALLEDAGGAPAPAFRDAHSPCAVLLAARGTRLVTSLGRAHQEEGNQLVALELGAGGAARLAWRLDGSGRCVRAGASEARLPAGLWGYQPGACIADELLLVLAQRFEGAPDTPPRVDEARAELWCLALALADGAPRWMRRLGRGADPATRDPARLPEPRGFCAPSEPLALADGRLWCPSGLGWISALALDGGRVLGAWRAGLEAEAPGERVLLRPVLLRGARALWAPAASRWVYELEPGGALRPAPRGEGRLPVARDARRSWWIAGRGGRWHVESALAGGETPRESVELARGEEPQAVLAIGAEGLALATDRALYLFDDRDPVRLTSRARLSAACAGSARGSGALLALGSRLVCAVGSSLASFRLR